MQPFNFLVIGAAVLALLSMSVSTTVAFQVQDVTNNRPRQQQQCGTSSSSSSSSDIMSRSQWLQTAAGASFAAAMTMAAVPSRPAFAKDVDPALKGTKKDPAFEACLSQCMYECTKPKGYEQKSRSECLPECKSQCATTAAQRMLGTPLAK